MNHDLLIQQCRSELEEEISILFGVDPNSSNDNNINNISNSFNEEQRINQIIEREINQASQLLLNDDEYYSSSFSNIPLQRVIDNYFAEFEKQVIKPLEMMETAFSKCLAFFYETLWKNSRSGSSDKDDDRSDESNNNKNAKKEELFFDMGMKISERGSHVEIIYWSLTNYEESKRIVPYDLKNIVSIFKELLSEGAGGSGGELRVRPISVFNLLFNLCLLIEELKFLTLANQCTKDSIFLKSICINRCFLDRDTILNNIDSIEDDNGNNQSLSDEDYDMIFHNSVKNFQNQREMVIDKIVDEHLSRNKTKDEGLYLVCKNGIMEKKRQDTMKELLEKERLFLDNKLSLRGQPPDKIPHAAGLDGSSKYSFEPIIIEKPKKKQETFIDFVYKTRGFKVTDNHRSNMKFASIIDKNTKSREKKPVPDFELPIQQQPAGKTVDDGRGGGIVARTASTLMGEYLRNISLKNNSFEQYKNARLKIMSNRLGSVAPAGRDHFTTLIIRRMRNRLKYLLSQPNHKVPVEKKEEAIIGFLRMLSQ